MRKFTNYVVESGSIATADNKEYLKEKYGFSEEDVTVLVSKAAEVSNNMIVVKTTEGVVIENFKTKDELMAIIEKNLWTTNTFREIFYQGRKFEPKEIYTVTMTPFFERMP